MRYLALKMAIKDKFYFIIFIDTNLTGYERIKSLLWSCQIAQSIKNADLMMEKERKKERKKESKNSRETVRKTS